MHEGFASFDYDSPDAGIFLGHGGQQRNVVIKGCEAAGFVSCETTLGLYAAVKEMLRASQPLMTTRPIPESSLAMAVSRGTSPTMGKQW